MNAQLEFPQASSLPPLYTADLALVDDSEGFFSDMGEVARARQDFNSPDSKPGPAGLYEVLAPIHHIRTGTRFYAVWNGEQWGIARAGKERAITHRFVPAVVQCKAWREIVAHA